MERLQFVTPWPELDLSILEKRNELRPSQLTAPMEGRREAFTPKANRHVKSTVCGTVAMLLTLLGSQRRKPRRSPTAAMQDKGGADKARMSSRRPLPPPPPPPPMPKAVPKTRATVAKAPPMRPEVSPATKPKEVAKEMPKSAPVPPPAKAEAPKPVAPEAKIPAVPAPEVAKEMPKSAPVPPPAKAEAPKPVAPEAKIPAAVPVPEEVPKSEASPSTFKTEAPKPPEDKLPTPTRQAAKELPKIANFENLEEKLREKDAENSILKKQLEELESYKREQERKERTAGATKAAAESEKKLYRRAGGPDEKSLADAQRLAQVMPSMGTAKQEDSTQIQQLKESLQAAQDKCLAKESEVFKLQLERDQAMTKARNIEETLKKVQEESQEVTKLKDVLKKIGEMTAPFVDGGEDPSLLRKKAEGSQRRAAALEAEKETLAAQLAQAGEELADLTEVEKTLAESKKRADSLSSSIREIAEQIGTTGGGLFSMFRQPSEEELIRDIKAEIEKLKS